VADIFADMLALLLSKPDSKVTDYRSLTDRDREKILEWNRKFPEVVDRCIHDVIQDHLMTEPESESVLAWDGSMTRRRLDELSSRLALELVELGIGPEVRVALCFEKSVSHFVKEKEKN
jgi:non-ribosomal peptide synthetase component F